MANPIIVPGWNLLADLLDVILPSKLDGVIIQADVLLQGGIFCCGTKCLE